MEALTDKDKTGFEGDTRASRYFVPFRVLKVVGCAAVENYE
jgi:hypothetical protein